MAADNSFAIIIWDEDIDEERGLYNGGHLGAVLRLYESDDEKGKRKKYE